MNFKITPDFSSKVFTKVAKLANQDFDLDSDKSQIDLCNGFVDYLQKEANMSPAMALGVIQYICERGAEWAIENSSDKVAAEEVWTEDLKNANQTIQELKLKIALEEINQKEAGFVNDVWQGVKSNVGTAIANTNPLGNLYNTGQAALSAGKSFLGNVKNTASNALSGVKETVSNTVGAPIRWAGNQFSQGAQEGVLGNIGNTLGKGFTWIKDNMGTIAPALAMGLVGALGTRAIGGKDTPGWMPALGGLAAAGGTYYGLNHTEAGKSFKEQIRKQLAQTFQR